MCYLYFLKDFKEKIEATQQSFSAVEAIDMALEQAKTAAPDEWKKKVAESLMDSVIEGWFL